MKNKLLKAFGIVASLMTVASLMVTAVPASATAQAWEKITTPGNIDWMVDPDVQWVGPIERAINGDLYCAVQFSAADPYYNNMAAGVYLFKSTDFGRTWTILNGANPVSDLLGSVANGYSEIVFDIECSSANANIVYFTNGTDIFKSVNGGVSFVTMDNLFDEESLDVDPAGMIVSISVGYYGGTAYLFAATSTFGPGGDVGGAYVFQESVFLSQWIDLEIASERVAVYVGGNIDVLAIEAMPDFSTTQGIMAIVSDYVSGETRVTTRFMGQQWAENASDVILMYNDSGIYGGQDYVDAVLLDATMWLPEDFSSDPESGLMAIYVGINPLDSSVPCCDEQERMVPTNCSRLSRAMSSCATSAPPAM
jgi:hypothetical protein